MSCENEFCAMQAMTRRRSAMLAALVLGLVGATMTGACGLSESACPAPDLTPPDTSIECPAPIDDQCMRYRICVAPRARGGHAVVTVPRCGTLPSGLG